MKLITSYYQILSQYGIKNSKISLKSIHWWLGSHWKKCTAGVINAQYGLNSVSRCSAVC